MTLERHAEEARKALDRIVKLVQLAAHNPHEEEARSAALRACKLMVEHQITLRVRGEPMSPTLPPWMPPSTKVPPGDLTASMRHRDEVRASFKEWERQYWDTLIRERRA